MHIKLVLNNNVYLCIVHTYFNNFYSIIFNLTTHNIIVQRCIKKKLL